MRRNAGGRVREGLEEGVRRRGRVSRGDIGRSAHPSLDRLLTPSAGAQLLLPPRALPSPSPPPHLARESRPPLPPLLHRLSVRLIRRGKLDHRDHSKGGVRSHARDGEGVPGIADAQPVAPRGHAVVDQQIVHHALAAACARAIPQALAALALPRAVASEPRGGGGTVCPRVAHPSPRAQIGHVVLCGQLHRLSSERRGRRCEGGEGGEGVEVGDRVVEGECALLGGEG